MFVSGRVVPLLVPISTRVLFQTIQYNYFVAFHEYLSRATEIFLEHFSALNQIEHRMYNLLTLSCCYILHLDGFLR